LCLQPASDSTRYVVFAPGRANILVLRRNHSEPGSIRPVE
jgi:hypothetical protein